MKTEIICCISCLLLGITASSQDVRTLDVTNQEQFNGIPGWIREMSKAGADRINVRIGKGVYRYPHMFINLFRAPLSRLLTNSRSPDTGYVTPGRSPTALMSVRQRVS